MRSLMRRLETATDREQVRNDGTPSSAQSVHGEPTNPPLNSDELRLTIPGRLCGQVFQHSVEHHIEPLRQIIPAFGDLPSKG